MNSDVMNSNSTIRVKSSGLVRWFTDRAKRFSFSVLMLLAIGGIAASNAHASHYRGGSATNTVSSDGVMTVDVYSAWRSDAVNAPSFSVLNSGGGYVGTMTVTLSETYFVGSEAGGASYTVLHNQFTYSLAGRPAGLYTAKFSSCCWVGGINNMAEDSWSLETVANYVPGSTSAGPTMAPATVDVVGRSVAYAQSLDSYDPDGTPVSFALLSTGVAASAPPMPGIFPGLSLTNGIVNISATNTASLALGRWHYRARVTDASGATASRDVLVVVQDLDQGGGPANNAPVLSSIGPKTVAVGSSLSFAVSATDPDTAQTLTLRGRQLPTGATFPNSVSATPSSTFNWTPPVGSEGVYSLFFEVFDNAATPLIDSEIVTITVTGVNNPPVLAAIGSKSVANGGTLSFSVSATDPDADGITYSASFLPAGATFVGDTFSWTPAVGQYDSTYTGIVLRATDDGSPPLFDDESISITVGAGNQMPVITPLSDVTVSVGSPVSFVVEATDVNTTQTLTLAPGTGGIPAGATFAGAVGTSPVSSSFSWTPTAPGTTVVRFRVEDNGSPILSQEVQVAINVSSAIDGVCGTANGGSPIAAAPASDLCAVGAASAVSTGALTFDWTCAGSSGGVTAVCAAPRLLNTTALITQVQPSALSISGDDVTVSVSVEGGDPTGQVTVQTQGAVPAQSCVATLAGMGSLSTGSCTFSNGNGNALSSASGLTGFVASYPGDSNDLSSAATVVAHRVVEAVNVYHNDGLRPAKRSTAHAKAWILVGSYPTLAAALAAASAGDEVVLGADTYLESGLSVAVNNLTIRGFAPAESDANAWTREPVSFVDGSNAAIPIITIANGVIGTTIRDIGLGNVRHNCVQGLAGNSNTTLERNLLDGCRADLAPGGSPADPRGGAFFNGPLDNVQFIDNELTNTAPRGVVIWNGFKTNIVFDGNYLHDLFGCCGIELQDGTASGVKITGNRIERSPDNAISVVGLTSGSGAPFNGENLIANNFILNAGRFGIEVKLPNGSGLDSGDGSIVVEGNQVYLTSTLDANFDGVLDGPLVPGIAQWRPAELRDLAGIAVMRRSVADAANVNVPSGVLVRNNTVGGYQQNNGGTPRSTGFGIVLGGVKHTVYDNTLLQNDVGIQRQAGHTPYRLHVVGADVGPAGENQGPFDGDQSNLADNFFGRDNSQLTCASVGSNTYSGSIIAMSRDVVSGAGVLVSNSVFNQRTTLGYCSIQAAIDDPLTLDGDVLLLSDDATYAEQIVISKSLRITRNGSGTNAPVILAPASVTDLALVRAAAPNIEIDNLDFVVDLSKVGEAIRSVGGTPAGEPDGLSIHHNTISSTASAAGFISYGRRNAISLNMGGSYALPGEQVTTLTVDVSSNTINGTQDWDVPTGGNQPAYFRSAIAIDQGEGVIAGNTLHGRDYDVFARFSNGTLDIGLAGNGNTFAGGGLYVGDGIQPVRVTDNSFAPDRTLFPFADYPPPFDGLLWGDMGMSAARLVNISDSVTLTNNTFSENSNAVFAQNFVDLNLLVNTFNAPTHGSQFRHLILSTKVLASNSATVTQVPLALASSGNTFNGSLAHDATAVELLNHDADNDQYGAISFADTFTGDFDFLFRLDPTTCATSSSCVATPYADFYQYGSLPNTEVAPFAGDVDATSSSFDGDSPSAMTYAQYQAIQTRTYHDDPNAPEAPAAPAALGIVNYGFASNLIPTTTTVMSTAPNPSAIGADVTVTVSVANDMGGVPAGSFAITAPGSAGCSIANYPTNTSCVITGGFASGGLVSVAASFSPSDTVNQPSNGARGHTVTYASPTIVPVDPAPVPTAVDNDYTRINNALQAAGSGVTIELSGDFNWTEPYAYASWKLGSDGVLGTDDDWSAKLPAGVSGATVIGATPGGASIQGDEGALPGDFAAFLYSGSMNQGWTFENLTVRGFDVAFAMFGSGTEGVNGTTYLNNRIEISPDSDDDFANYGIYSSYGEQQTVAGSEIVIDITDADGDALGDNSRVIGIQIGDSCNGNCFDGLVISSNTITVTGVPAAVPPRVIGIWENAGDTNSSIHIEDNTFTGSGDFGSGVESNEQTAFIASTQSNGANQSAFSRNTISGAAFGLRSQLPAYGHYIGSNAPLLIEGNTFTGNGTALRLHGAYPNAGQYTVQFNRIAGNVIGLFAERADDLPVPGDPGYGGDELPTQIAANDNWWGCNAGPADVDCDSIVIEAGTDSANVTQATWLQLRATASPAIVVPPASSAITVDLVSSSDGLTVATAFPDDTAIGLVTSKAAFNPPAPFATASGQIGTSLEGLNSGIALMTATLDNQDVDFDVTVAGPVTVNDDTANEAHADARATCATPDFSTIQDAIDTMPAGTEILVCAGVYKENLSINQAVSLLGSQAGQDARNRSDVGASIVVPAHGNPALDYDPNATFTSLLDIFADDVSVDGFVFDGDNPDIFTGLGMGSADPDIDGGLQIGGERIAIRNNVVRNLVYSAIEAYRYPLSEPVSEGNTIHRNWIHNLDAPSNWGVGILTHYNYYAAVTENLVENVRIGFQTGNHTKSISDPSVDALVADNVFEASATGIYHNAQYGSASPFTFRDNVILANLNPNQAGIWVGFGLGALSNSTTATVQGNDVDGSALLGSGRDTAGFRATLIKTTLASTVAIDGGSISNVDYGVLATDGAYFPGAQDDVLVKNVAFSDISLAALYVEDTALTIGETVDHSPRLTVGTGNSFINVLHEGALSGPLARIDMAPGASLLQTVFIRTAGVSLRGALTDYFGNVRTVNPGTINDGIADAAITGTVTLEAGTFAQTVIVNKSVSLVGPFVGVHGNDLSRGGISEAVLNQLASAVPLTVSASNVTVDGLTIDNVTGLRMMHVQSGAGTGIKVLNNRLTNYTAVSSAGTGLQVGITDGIEIAGNLFSDFHNGTGYAMGLRLDTANNGLIHDNQFWNVQSVNIQASQCTGTNIFDNQIDATAAPGTGNAGVQVAQNDNVKVYGNTIGHVDSGLLVTPGNTATTSLYCNTVSASGRGLFVMGNPPWGGVQTMGPIFHNDLQATTPVSFYNWDAGQMIVGSNYYGGATPTSATELIADPLGVSPIGQTGCGDNTPFQMVMYPSTGTGQSTDLNQPFANPLRSRVQDALGGAVMGESVTVSAPASGASALLTPTNGALPTLTTDYNGVVELSAIANGFAGNYDVTTTNSTDTLAFDLTNVALSQVQFDLNGPIGGVEVGDEVPYSGYIANQNPNVTENVYIHLDVSATSALDPADVTLCVINPMLPSQCIPLVFSDNGATLSLDFTDNTTGFPITAPYQFLHNFRVTFGKAGVFTTSAQVIGAVSGTVYASDLLSTEVIAQHAGITLDLNGPVAGVERDVPTAYSATLSNAAADVADPVVVEFVLTRTGPGAIATTDVTVEYDTGGGVFAPITLDGSTPGQLVGIFGPSSGFPLLAGHNATTPLRVTYHVAPDTFTVMATVIDGSGGDTDGVLTYAADNLSTEVIEPDPDVTLDINGPVAGVEVEVPTAYSATLRNTSTTDVPDGVVVQFVLTRMGGINPPDVTVEYDTGGGVFAPITLDGSTPGQLVGIFGPASGFPLLSGHNATTPLRVTYHAAPDTFTVMATVIDGTAGDTDGVSSYAADNLSTVVILPDPDVSLDLNGPVAGVEKDVATAYSATLRNDSTDVPDNVVVEFVLTRTGPGAIATTDVTVEYDSGGGVYAPIPLDDSTPGQLVGIFGPGSGFPLLSGHNATTPLRVTYHVAPDTFTVMATVRDAAGDTDGVPSYAADNLSTVVVEADPDVTMSLAGPFDLSDGVTPAATRTADQVLLRGELRNDGGDVADLVQASFSIGSNLGGLIAADVNAVYWFVLPATACGPVPGTPETVVFTENAGNLEASTIPQPLLENSAVSVCFAVTFNRAGLFSVGAVIEDAVPDTDGTPTYAGDNLMLTVGKGAASIALSDLGPFVYDGLDHAATATVTRTSNGDPLPAVSVDFTYNGGATLPNGAGSYSVQATASSADWEGTASGTLTITKAPVTLVFGDLSQTYDGTAKVASVVSTPVVAGIVLSYAPVSTPINAGSYTVTASLVDANYELSGPITDTLVIDPAASGISVAPVSVNYDGQPHATSVNNPNGEQISISYAGTSAGGNSYGPSAIPPTNAGSYTATVTVTDPNYAGGPFSGSITIAAISTDVTLSNLSQVYDGSQKPVTATATNPAATFLLEYDGNAVPPTDAGSYTVTVSSASENYALGTVTPSNPAMLLILKAPVMINFTALNFVSNGSPQPAQFTVTPTPGSGNDIVCTDVYTPGTTAPVTPGMYAVSVTCEGSNYSGSATATVNITDSPVSTLELFGSDTFAGVAGAPLPAPGPTVRVLDGNGDPVQGTSIQFQITGGNGSIASGGSVVATDVNGEAEVGAWTLDRDASASNTLSATVVGRGDIAAISFSATGAEEADVGVVKTSSTSSARVGDSVDYLITVTNAGPSNATSVDVLDLLPDQLDVGTASWICIEGGGASCAAASGSGDLLLNGSVPVGGSLTILLSATIIDSLDMPSFDNTAVVDLLSGTDGNNGNDASTHSITILPPIDPFIFKDGFEGAALPRSEANDLGLMSLRVGGSALRDGLAPHRLLSLPDASGGSSVEVVGFYRDDTLWVRLGGVASDGRTLRSGWVAVPDTSLSMSWRGERDGIRYEVNAGDSSVHLLLSGVAPPKIVNAAAGVTVH